MAASKGPKTPTSKNERWEDDQTLALIAHVGENYELYRSFPSRVIHDFCEQNPDLRGHDTRVKNKFDYLVRQYEVVRKEFKQTGKGSMENDPNTTEMIKHKMFCFFELHAFLSDRVSIQAPFARDAAAKNAAAANNTAALVSSAAASSTESELGVKRTVADPLFETLMQLTKRGMELQERQVALHEEELSLKKRKFELQELQFMASSKRNKTSTTSQGQDSWDLTQE